MLATVIRSEQREELGVRSAQDFQAQPKTEHGIYMVGDSRMNIAGLNAQSVPILAKAIIDVGV